METINVNLDLDLETLTEKLKEYKQLTEEDGEMEDYIFEIDNFELEIRAFPSGGEPNYTEYPVKQVEIQVKVKPQASWYDNFVEYGGFKENIRNSDSPMYQELADAVEQAIEDAGFSNPSLVAEPGSYTFEDTLKV